MPVFRIDDPIPLQEADGLWRDLRPNYEAIDIPANLRFFTIPGKKEHGPQPYIMWSNGRKMRVRCEVIVLDQQGRMLIKPNPSFKRLGDTYQYDLPGGGIDKGETVEEAATRECKEEALLIPENVKFTGIHYTYEVPDSSKEAWAYWGHISFVCVGMKGDPYTGYVAPMDREESFVKRMQWVYPHEIGIIPAHEEAIRWYKQYYQARDSVMQHGPSYAKLDESTVLEATTEFQPMSTASQPGRVYDPQLGIWIDPKTKDQDKYCGWFVADEKEWLKKVKFISDPNVRGGKPQPVIYDEKGNTFRPRCEVIVLDGYKVLIDPKKNRGNFHPPYSLPGGGVDGKESIADCARRECEEEARVIPKGCVYTGIAWKLEFADPVFNKGSISFICIAERGKDYKGYVKVEDRDPFVDRAKWVDYRKFKLGEPHQKAIDIFRKMQLKEEGIADLNTSFLNEEYEMPVDEETGIEPQPVVFSNDDIYVNFDKFKSRKAKTCLITGLSGSGKSTLAKKLAERLGAYYVATDVISFGISSLHPERANWDYIKENDRYLYRYFKEKGLQPDCLQKYDWHGEEKNEIVTPYIKWLCLERDDDDLVVCEGGDVAIALRDTPELEGMPIVFKGTSITKSMFRRFLRMSGKHDVWFAIKNVIDKFAYQYGKMIPEVNAARRTILGKSEYEYQHEAGPYVSIQDQ